LGQADKRELYNGFGGAFSLAFEIALTPMVFALMGWVLDRWLGTGRLFMLGLLVFGIVGVLVKAYYAYTQRMLKEEAAGPWGRR
jgi:F0F1-type ATP synthase assembly protein I